MATNSSIDTSVSNLPDRCTAHAARKGFGFMLLAAAGLMVAWSFAVPVFEGSDEPAHWQYAHYLNHNRALPIYGTSFPEANSPPLYYLLIAPLAVDAKLPPAAYAGDIYAGSIPSRFPPRAYQNAYRDFGRYWPFRAARLVSVLISVFTIWFCASAGTEASRNSWTGLLVGGLVAFWPMFTARGMEISNDVLVAMLSALTLYMVVRLIKRGFTWVIGIFAALTVGGAFLSKASAMILPVPLLLAIISEKAPWRAKLMRAGVLGAIMLMVVAPWLIRNQHLYGDPLAQKAMLTAMSGIVVRHSLGSGYFASYFPLALIMSFIGTFGWGSLRLPVWTYLVYAIALVTAGLCWIDGIERRRIDLRLSAILFSVVVLNLMIVVYINLTFKQPLGRYMLPSFPAIALLLGLGLASLRSWSGFRTMLTLGVLATSNLVILVAWVIPAYWPPVIK